QLRALRILVVGTIRDAEARLAPERAEILDKVARDAEVLPLGRLALDDVAHLVAESRAGAGDGLADSVHRTTEGNPLFVDEVLRLLESRGAGADLPDPVPIPDGIRAAIREHVAQVSAPCRAVLEAAAICGRDAALELVARVVEGDVPATAQRLAEAV